MSVMSKTFLEHHNHGQQTFDLSKKMSKLLMETDLENIHPNDLKLPYGCFYVAFPEKSFQVWEPESGWVECDGVYIRNTDGTEFPIREAYLPFVLVFMSHSGKEWKGKNGRHPEDQAVSWIPCPFHSPESIRGDSSNQTFWGEELSETWGNDNIKIEELSPLEVLLTVKAALILKQTFKHSRKNPNFEWEDARIFLNNLVKMGKIAMNLLVYLNHGLKTKEIQTRGDSAPIKHHLETYEKATSKARKKNASEQATRLSIANVHSLDHGVQGLRAMKATDIYVRGHWHTYWIGKGRKERTLKWIQPHIRNADTGVPKNKTRKYIV